MNEQTVNVAFGYEKGKDKIVCEDEDNPLFLKEEKIVQEKHDKDHDMLKK